MTITDAMKKGFKTTNSLKKVVGVFFLWTVVSGGLGHVLGFGQEMGAEPDLRIGLFSLVMILVSIGVTIFLEGGALGVIKEHLKLGESFGYGRFFGYAKKFFLPLLLTFLLFIALYAGSAMVLFLPLMLTFVVPVLSVLGVLLVVAGLVVINILLLYPQFIVVAEEESVIEAFKKSIRFAKNNFKSTLLLVSMYVLTAIVFSAVLGIVLMIAMFATGALFGFAEVPWLENFWGITFGLIFGLLFSYFQVLYLSVFMNFYLGLTATSSGGEAIEMGAPAGEIPEGPFSG